VSFTEATQIALHLPFCAHLLLLLLVLYVPAGNVNMLLPNSWLWAMVDEFLYQFQSFATYRAKLSSKSAEEIELLKKCDKVGPGFWVLGFSRLAVPGFWGFWAKQQERGRDWAAEEV
jgi:hypothetical protein